MLALASALLVTGLAGSASAAVAGLQVVSAASAFNSSDKSATVSCPAGKRVVGAGGAVASLPGEAGQVAVDDIRPDAGLTSVTVEGLEDENGFASNWDVTANAVCANPLPGLERVAATSALNSSNKGVTATCPAGKRVVGAGGDVNTLNDQVLLDDVRPSAALTSVTVNALEDETGNPASWSVTAYAICANPVAGLERVAVTSDLTSANKTVTASCPGGKDPLGTGGDINTLNGQVLMSHLRPIAPFDFGSGVFYPTSVFVFAAEDETGNAAGWSLTAYAICAPGSVPSATSGRNFSSSNQSVTAVCPAGKRVVGAGGSVSPSGGQVLLDDVRPDSGLTSVTTQGLEDEDGTTGFWNLTADAVCATPLAGLERIAATSALSSSNKSVTATCPAGKRVVGAGGDVNTFNGQVLLDDLRPNAALTSVTVQGLEDETGNPANWSLTAYAICANPVAGLERVAVTSDLNSVNKTVAASCPGGKNLLGVGGDVNTFNGQVVLAEVRSQASLTSVVVRGEEDQTGNAAGWSVTAYGICASP